MCHTSSTLSSVVLHALASILVVIVPTTESIAQSTSRSFQMALWESSLDEPNIDTDIAVFWAGNPQPDGHSIMIKADWEAAMSANTYDWPRIVAVVIDEPYLALERNILNPPAPCRDVNQWNAVDGIDQVVAARAAELRALSPLTRLWVNLTKLNVAWMKDPACVNKPHIPLNRPYIDVISFDYYYEAFDPGLIGDYEWLYAHRAKADQQLALIPGTFYRPGKDNQTTRASYMLGYFEYANDKNQTCNLPLGDRGRTGSFDGCPVWLVMGWLAGTVTDGDTHVGELDPSSAPISTVWQGQLALPLRSGLANQVAPGMLPPILLLED